MFYYLILPNWLFLFLCLCSLHLLTLEKWPFVETSYGGQQHTSFPAHQSYMPLGCPLCGGHMALLCGRLTAAGGLVGVADCPSQSLLPYLMQTLLVLGLGSFQLLFLYVYFLSF